MIDLNLCSDEQLVVLYKNGNEKAFNELYTRYALKLKKIIYYYILNPDDVDDVFHETNIRILRHIDSFREDLQFSSWVYKIAVNCSKNYLKNKKRMVDIIEREKYRLISSKDHVETPEEDLINQRDMQEFNNAVKCLKEKYRDVFILRFDQKLKYKDIAVILSCSERTAKWRMKRAVGEITNYLQKRGIV